MVRLLGLLQLMKNEGTSAKETCQPRVGSSAPAIIKLGQGFAQGSGNI
jgi:hypothetical protein